MRRVRVKSLLSVLAATALGASTLPGQTASSFEGFAGASRPLGRMARSKATGIVVGAEWDRGRLSIDGSVERLPGRFRGTTTSPPFQMASISLATVSLGVLARDPHAAAGPYFRAALGLARASRTDASYGGSALLTSVGAGYTVRVRNLRLGVGVHERMFLSSYVSGSEWQVGNLVHFRASMGAAFR